jgi:hypothetical protein
MATLIYFLVTVLTPNGKAELEVPSTLGTEAAARRAHITAVSLGWGDMDTVTVESVALLPGQSCEAFLMCTREASTLVNAPGGKVAPACAKCAATLGEVPFTIPALIRSKGTEGPSGAPTDARSKGAEGASGVRTDARSKGTPEGGGTRTDNHPSPAHVDYPHEPGRLYDCPACEAECHCTGDPGHTPCIYCAESECAD